MDVNMAIGGFMNLVREDPRIGPSHISLYLSIIIAYQDQGYKLPLSVYSKDLMKQAKIGGMATYRKCMRDLVEYGYIGYIPSFNPILGSLVYVNDLND